MTARKRKINLIIIVLLTLALIAGSIFLVIFFSKSQVKKAIIMVTPLLGGGLYDTATGEPIWDPFIEFDFSIMALFGSDAMSTLMGDVVDQALSGDTPAARELSGILSQVLGSGELFDDGYLVNPDGEVSYSGEDLSVLSFLHQMLVDADGKPLNENIKAANDYVGKVYYGALGMYKDMILELTDLYGEKADVKMFNYDWRMDNTGNSILLEKFINDGGWDEVVLISHSMGGNVSAGYLARSQENRDKIVCYMPCAASFLGSIDAITYLYDTDSFISGVPDALDGIISPIMAALKALVANVDSITQLLPSYELLASVQYTDTQSIVYVDGEPLRTKDELYNFYKSQDWAYKRSITTGGTFAFILDEDGNKIMRDAVKNLEAFHASQYVDVNGEPVFAANLVNTYYHVGIGQSTKVSFHSNTGKWDYDFDKNTMGDNQVPLYSQTGGLKLSEIENGHVFFYPKTHMEVGGDWEMMRDNFLYVIDMYI